MEADGRGRYDHPALPARIASIRIGVRLIVEVGLVAILNALSLSCY